MLSIQQLIKTLKKLQNNTKVTSSNSGDLLKTIKNVTNAKEIAISTAIDNTNRPKSSTTSLRSNSNSGSYKELTNITNAIQTTSSVTEQTVQGEANDSHSGSDCDTSCSLYDGFESTSCSNNNSSQQSKQQTPHKSHFSLYSHLNVEGSKNISHSVENSTTHDSSKVAREIPTSISACVERQKTYSSSISGELHHHHQINNKQPQQQQRIHNFVLQKIYNQFQQFHTQHNQHLNTKQKQTHFAMSSLAAEPLAAPKLQQKDDHHSPAASSSNNESSKSPPASKQPKSTSGKPCFSSGLGDIIQFMELIGNLKHTKRTGWVLRDINDCESISGHMYRMSILTFLLDGTEGLNQIRCMELALVHDLAESLVGDITPFCGVAKQEKKAMEFKAMVDICKLIEPRGKRMMELFEEYEKGQSPESRFVKDLDRLDMVMQAFEYEKRDNCLLKHQEFFDSTEGKFNHPFVKKLVEEIYEQREKMAKAKGATPPPKVDVPNMDDPTTHASKSSNGHHDQCASAESSLNENPDSKKIS